MTESQQSGEPAAETRHAPSIQRPNQRQQHPNPEKSRFQNIGQNTASSIIESYKSAITKHANRLELPHDWQDLPDDHIIRNDAEYQRISDYIVSNPVDWDKDKFNSDK